jgi:tetratricopeptide (TPR) repeat protein
MQVFFSGGAQKFRLVDLNGKPQSGFSIFASYDTFSTDQECYQATTDLSAEFSLQDSQKKPLFVSIAQNVEGVNFAFARKIVVVEEGKEVVDIPVTGLAEAQKEAQKILPQRLEQKRLSEIQRTIRMRLEQAREHMKKYELNEATLAIRLAKESLKELGAAPNVDELRQALQNIEQVYQEALVKKQAQDSYLAAMKLLDEVDGDVGRLQYPKALAKLTRAQEMWPRNFYGEEYKEVSERQQRIQVLQQQEISSLGKARRVVRDALTWKVEDVSLARLKELGPHVKILFQQGEMDTDRKYHDKEVWLRLRVFLDRLSHDFAARAQEYLRQYDQASSALDRRKIYEDHEKCYQCSRLIDDWLQSMK